MSEENPRRGRKKREEVEGRRERLKEEIKNLLIQDIGEEILRELAPLLELSDEEIKEIVEIVRGIPRELRRVFIKLLDEVSDEEIEGLLEEIIERRVWEAISHIPKELRKEFITLVKRIAEGKEPTGKGYELLTDYPKEVHLLSEWWRGLSKRWKVELKDILEALLMDYITHARTLVEWRGKGLKDVLKLLLSLRDLQLSDLHGALLREPSALREVIESVKPAPPPTPPPAPPPKPPEKAPPKVPPKAPPKPPEKVPRKAPPKPPKPSKPAKPAAKPAVKPPKLPKRPWRSVWPFKTATFIRSYLKLKGEATPYEVYRAFVHTITLIIKDEKFREEIEKKRGIRVDGTIDEDIVVKEFLATGVPEYYKKRMIELGIPLYHKTSYTSFWRYFYILERLGLIERVGKREWKKGFFRQRYRIVEGQEDSELWEYPQSVLYPLSFLGRQRYKVVSDIAAEMWAEKEHIDLGEVPVAPRVYLREYTSEKERLGWIVKALEKKYKGAVEELARRRGVSVRGLLRIIRTQSYIRKKKIEESMERVKEIGEEKAKSLERKKE